MGGPDAARAANGDRYGGTVLTAAPGEAMAPPGSITSVRIPDSKCDATATWARNASMSLVTTITPPADGAAAPMTGSQNPGGSTTRATGAARCLTASTSSRNPAPTGQGCDCAVPDRCTYRPDSPTKAPLASTRSASSCPGGVPDATALAAARAPMSQSPSGRARALARPTRSLRRPCSTLEPAELTPFTVTRATAVNSPAPTSRRSRSPTRPLDCAGLRARAPLRPIRPIIAVRAARVNGTTGRLAPSHFELKRSVGQRVVVVARVEVAVVAVDAVPRTKVFSPVVPMSPVALTV